jgi:hypothetical protein
VARASSYLASAGGGRGRVGVGVWVGVWVEVGVEVGVEVEVEVGSRAVEVAQ